MQRIKCLVVFLWLAVGLKAQGIRHIDAVQGLGHPTVYAITSDDLGFVWMGTRDGLYRYNDGRAQLVPFLEKTTARRTTNVQSLCVAQDSILWIGLQQGGIVAYNIHRLQPIADAAVPQLPLSTTVMSIFEDSYGTLWAATAGEGIYALHNGASGWERLGFDYAPEDVLFGFDFAQQGDTLWLGTSGSHLLYYDYSLRRILSIASGDVYDSYRKSVTVAGGKVIIGIEDQGIVLVENGQIVRLPALPVAPWVINPRDVAVHEGEIWVSTDGDGMWVWNGEHWRQFTKNVVQLGMTTDQLYAFTKINNEFWVGTFNGGVTIFPLEEAQSAPLAKPNRFIPSGIQSALSLENVDGTLWAGFDGDGVVLYKRTEEGWVPEEADATAMPKVTPSMLLTSDSTLWLGSFNEGIFVYDKDGSLLRRFVAFTPIANGLGNNNIWSLAQGKGDSIWVGTLGGLYLWDGTEFTLPWRSPWEVGRNIMDLKVYDDAAWVATEFQGLYRIESNLSYTNWSLDHPILSIEQHNDKLYVGTEGGGLYSVTPSGFDTLIAPSTYVSVYGLTSYRGVLWIASSNGLLRLSEEDQASSIVAEASMSELSISLFNRKSLLPWGDDLLIGGDRGVVSYRIEQNEVEDRGQLAITGIYQDNEIRQNPVYTGINNEENALIVPAGVNSIEFNYEWIGKQGMLGGTVFYQVDGISDQWLQLNARSRSFSLNNLRPGNYRLKLELRNDAGAVLSALEVPFVQKAHLWEKRWFRIVLVVLSFVIVGGSIAVYQERKLKETRLQLLETEKALLSAKAGEMEAKAKEKTDELNFQLLKTSSRVELLKEFKDKLDSESKMPNRSTETKSLLRGLIRELNRELQSENYWDHFERNYKDLHDAFSDTLIAVHPGLTKGEIRLSYLIRQKMNNKEIATVLNVSPAAVEKAKYRLKKKITLAKDESLDTYIQQL